jgi:hypothetical protein
MRQRRKPSARHGALHGQFKKKIHDLKALKSSSGSMHADCPANPTTVLAWILPSKPCTSKTDDPATKAACLAWFNERAEHCHTLSRRLAGDAIKRLGNGWPKSWLNKLAHGRYQLLLPSGQKSDKPRKPLQRYGASLYTVLEPSQRFATGDMDAATSPSSYSN